MASKSCQLIVSSKTRCPGGTRICCRCSVTIWPHFLPVSAHVAELYDLFLSFRRGREVMKGNGRDCNIPESPCGGGMRVDVAGLMLQSMRVWLQPSIESTSA